MLSWTRGQNTYGPQDAAILIMVTSLWATHATDNHIPDKGEVIAVRFSQAVSGPGSTLW
jgi:hypothetical protein